MNVTYDSYSGTATGYNGTVCFKEQDAIGDMCSST